VCVCVCHFLSKHELTLCSICLSRAWLLLSPALSHTAIIVIIIISLSSTHKHSRTCALQRDRPTNRNRGRQTDRQTDRLDFNVLLITQFHRRTIKLGHKTESILTAFPIFEEEDERRKRKRRRYIALHPVTIYELAPLYIINIHLTIKNAQVL